jgi:hypothetical protein
MITLNRSPTTGLMRRVSCGSAGVGLGVTGDGPQDDGSDGLDHDGHTPSKPRSGQNAYDAAMVVQAWDPDGVGVVALPSGRLVRGRGLRHPRTDKRPEAGIGERADEGVPTFGVYLLGTPPAGLPWESRWIRWPDFWLPRDRDEARTLLVEAWQRAVTDRVEVACGGGRGRTGTALACLAIIDGVPARAAVAYIRERYDRRAVETPWQRRYVERFDPLY